MKKKLWIPAVLVLLFAALAFLSFGQHRVEIIIISKCTEDKTLEIRTGRDIATFKIRPKVTPYAKYIDTSFACNFRGDYFIVNVRDKKLGKLEEERLPYQKYNNVVLINVCSDDSTFCDISLISKDYRTWLSRSYTSD